MLVLSSGISAHKSELMWLLTTCNTTYALGVDSSTGVLLQLYWGPRLATMQDIEVPIRIPSERSSQDPPISSANEEFPVFGGLRYGPDLLRVEFENGTRELDLVYASANLDPNELSILLVDRIHKGFRVKIVYSIDIENDIILKKASFEASEKEETYYISKAQSAAWHIPPVSNGHQRELVSLAGAWSTETQVQKHSLQPGTSHVLESTRGIPSVQAYPYFAVVDQSGDGEHGDCEVFFGTLGWSGSWSIECHTDIEGKVTVVGGIHDRDFGLQLNNCTIELPTFIAGYTAEGLSGARKNLANHVRENKENEWVIKPNVPAPVLYNGWENYAFDVNIKNQIDMATRAKEIGAELFVLDDGWFHNRHSDEAGLGDWFPDKTKFPDGLKPLSNHVHKLGMDFGLWFEPEMVNPDSNLYREHPDWVYHYPERDRHLSRNQLVLDITRNDVRQHILDCIIKLIQESGVDFVKWDMNRPISEAGAKSGKGVWLQHPIAFHSMIKEIKLATGVSIETCSSGGGRADYSILKLVESCWPSDNTRPDARIMIQYGASFVIPANNMSCWVTDMPNDDPHNNIPLAYRFHVSYMGSLGIGSNLKDLSPADINEYKGWITLYKEKLRHVLQMGDMDWLVVPSNTNKSSSSVSCYTAVTQTSSKEGDEAVVLAFRQYSPFWLPLHPIKLRRLKSMNIYKVTIWHDNPASPVFEEDMSGSALMNVGVKLPYLTSKSWSSVVLHVKKK